MAAAYEQLFRFNIALEKEWIPGFLRSYERRQATFMQAQQRYQERSRLVRLIFKQPKPPNKLPAGIQSKISNRAWQDWINSLRDNFSQVAHEREHMELMRLTRQIGAPNESESDPVFIVHNINARFSNHPITAIVGSNGSWYFNPLDNPNDIALETLPVHNRKLSNEFTPKVMAIPGQENPGLQTIFENLDDLLTYHQACLKEKTESALERANQIIAREKKGLLKLAASL
ncbi:MAG: hypothetical protein R3293_11760 [Candidatus Promineifilaceae bacterium]|nr:hypothetical protein [Candidatus Promineifilaceae bacterium]